MVDGQAKEKVSQKMDEIQESNSLFQDVWGMYAKGAGGEIIEQPGVIATWAGVQWPIVNVVFLSSPSTSFEELDSRLQRIATFAAAKNHPGMLIMCADWLPAGSDQLFQQHGWVQISEAIGMVCEKPVADVSTEGLEYRRIDNQDLRCAAADINASGYHVSSEMAREALDHGELWDADCFGYVGYLDGTAVATSTTYVRSGCLYVALVATLPEFRRRGFARAITSYSIQQAQKASGFERTILHATPMAREIYASLGFRTVTTFPMLLPAALLSSM